MFQVSSIVTILCTLINNCFSSSGNYSNFCLKLLKTSWTHWWFLIFLHLKLLQRERGSQGKLNLIWVLISNLFFTSSSSRTCYHWIRLLSHCGIWSLSLMKWLLKSWLLSFLYYDESQRLHFFPYIEQYFSCFSFFV